MAPPTISRIHLTDDTGQGEDGTVIDDALFQTLQDNIDALSVATSALITANANAITAIQPAPGQIAFPATQNPSANPNVLDDYEEGTWVPVIGGATSTSGQTYTTQGGWYVKIGRLVTVGYNCVLSAKGTITGPVQIQGLPFVVAVLFSGAFVSHFTGLAVAKAMIGGYCYVGTTAIQLVGTNAPTTDDAPLAAADIGNLTQFCGGGSYITN
jgi:hypothetical protein